MKGCESCYLGQDLARPCGKKKYKLKAMRKSLARKVAGFSAIHSHSGEHENGPARRIEQDELALLRIDLEALDIA